MFIVGANGFDVISPPGLFVHYNCSTNIVKLGIEWLGSCCSCVLANMVIDFNNIEQQEHRWAIQVQNINETKKQIESNPDELDTFEKVLSKNDYAMNPFYLFSLSII